MALRKHVILILTDEAEERVQDYFDYTDAEAARPEVLATSYNVEPVGFLEALADWALEPAKLLPYFQKDGEAAKELRPGIKQVQARPAYDNQNEEKRNGLV
jgi:hypothetical protein